MKFIKNIHFYNNELSRFVYRNLESASESMGSYEKQKRELMKNIGEFATDYEQEAKEGEYYDFGNLGDQWFPAIDDLFELSKKEFNSLKGKKKERFGRKTAKELRAVVDRVKGYLKNSMYGREDITSHEEVLKWEIALHSMEGERLSSFEQKKMGLLSGIDRVASDYEKQAKEGNEWYGWGNLGDQWFPAIENLFEAYEKELTGVKGAEKDRMKKEMMTDCASAVGRIKEYVDANPEEGEDEISIATIKDLKSRLLDLYMG